MNDDDQSPVTMNGLIFGFGRMGITHMALLNQMSASTISWVIVEPNFLLRLAGKFLFRRSGISFYSKLPSNSEFDLAIICSPVPFHAQNYRQCMHHAKKIFIEKPLNIPDREIADRSNILPGYVLRQNTLVAETRALIKKNGLTELEITLGANTAAKGADGWRFSTGAGVIDEFGCHVINLALFLSDVSPVLSESKVQSINTKVPDSFESVFDANGVKIVVGANWCEEAKRKPVYNVKAVLKNGNRIETDLYELVESDADGNTIKKLSLAGLGVSTKYYLRGFEFSNQAEYFLKNSEFSADLEDAIQTDLLLEKISDGVNTRR
jgi:predicted dehydrogenase